MILNEIIAYKKQEIEENKSLYPIKLLEKSIYFQSTSVSLKKYILREDKNGIIAEFKRYSPSAGDINLYAQPEKVSIGYMQAGASAISILTDQKYFKGNNADLTNARKVNYCPILRKDFIIDEYQLIEAKSIGADAVLLIAAGLSKSKCKSLVNLAHDLGLEVLLELHSENEIEYSEIYDDIIGINNRNLQNFSINLGQSSNLLDKLPKHSLKIAESGIRTVENVIQLREIGFQGFLIGERFMRSSSPEKECKAFINELNLHLKEKQYELAI